MIIAEGSSDILYHMTDKRAAVKILKNNKFILMPAFVGPEKEYSEKNKIYYMSMARSKSSSYFEVFGESPVLFVMNGRKLKQQYRIKPIDFFSDLSDGVYSGQPSERSTGYSEMEDRLISKTNTLNTKQYVTEIHTILPSEKSPNLLYAFLIWKYGKKLGIPVFFYDNYKNMMMSRNSIKFDYKKYANILKIKTEPVVQKMVHRQFKPYRELLLVKRYNQLSEEAKNLLKSFHSDQSSAINKMERFVKKYSKTAPSELKEFYDLLIKNRFKTYEDYIDFVLMRFDYYLS
jgi:hypothetical protein